MKYALLEAAVSCGSPYIGSEYAYDAIMPRLVKALGEEKLSLYPMEKRTPVETYPAELVALDTVLAVSEEIRRNALFAIGAGEFPVTIGGDHSVAMGTLAAAGETYGAENVALVYIDAHTDINTIESSTSHMIHGMDLAEALGYTGEILHVGENDVDILGENIHFIGPRSVDEPEWTIIKNAGCHLHTGEEVRRRGVAAVTEEVLRAVEGKKVVISFDVDVMNPATFRATGYNIPGGLVPTEVANILASFFSESDVVAFECVEYSPRKDETGKDLDTLVDILLTVLK